MNEQKKQKFETLFSSTKQKMGENKTIDFQGADATKLMKKSDKEKLVGKKKRHAVYLSEAENQAFLNTFKPRETASERIRNLILEDIKKRKE